MTGIWVLDLTDGSLVRAPENALRVRSSGFEGGSYWTTDGELTLWAIDRHDRGAQQYLRWNPRSDKVVVEGTETLSSARRWIRRSKQSHGYVVTWPDRDLEVVLPLGCKPYPSPEQGILFYIDVEGRVVRYSFLNNTSRVLAGPCEDPERQRIEVSPDGRRLCVQVYRPNAEVRYLDSETGEPLVDTLTGWSHHYVWPGAGADVWAVCVQHPIKDGKVRIMVLGDGYRQEISVKGWRVRALNRDRILVLDDHARRLTLIDGKGHLIRTLYEPYE